MNHDEVMEGILNKVDNLDLSIKKWDDIVNGKGFNSGSDNCALCFKYLDLAPSCEGCPISEATKESGCDGTPYRRFILHVRKCKTCDDTFSYCERGIKLAKVELDFLLELRRNRK